MIGAAICWAAGIVVMKGDALAGRDHGAHRLAAALGGVPIVLAWLVLEPHPDLSHLTWTGALATLYACHRGPDLLLRRPQQGGDPAAGDGAAAISTLAIPVVGLLSSAWLLGEPVGWREVGGPVLVLAAMSLVLLRGEPAGVAGPPIRAHAKLPAPSATDITAAPQSPENTSSWPIL